MTDFSKILDKAKELEAKVKESQENIKKIKAEGISGSNSVKIILDGEGEMQKIEISNFVTVGRFGTVAPGEAGAVPSGLARRKREANRRVRASTERGPRRRRRLEPDLINEFCSDATKRSSLSRGAASLGLGKSDLSCGRLKL